MATALVPPTLIFDGDCAFCSSSVRAGKRWMRRMPAAVPYQTADLSAVGLTEQQCSESVRYVDANGTLFAAHDAVGALLRDAGRGWWLLGSLERVPGIRWLSGVAYRWIAKNRYRLPGGTPACSLSDRH
jgi:predicted DCC family thiol-disulfide oxidoreductase YuxK